jgi:hypothetical protein
MDAVQRGCIIRMLAIEPECDNAGYRAAEVRDSFTPQIFKQQVANFIVTIGQTAAQVKNFIGSVEVRTYGDLPSVPLYIVQRAELPIRGYSSFFFHQATDGYFHISWRYAQGGFLADASEYFERKWKDNEKNSAVAFNVEGSRELHIAPVYEQKAQK